MCGIIGWYNNRLNINSEENINVLKDMTNIIEHRGPDDGGYYYSTNVLFGHRRLAIIDPEKGAQPMIKYHKGEQYIIVYNGELYNTDEIRHRLISLGYSFDTNCDTEVVLASYIEYGEKCVQHFNGIFAFSIFDKIRKKMFLARDHFGVKPLFYFYNDKDLIFASEIKSLLIHPFISPRINSYSLAEMFYIGPGRNPGSGVFENIKELLPGHTLTIDSKIQINKYFELTAKEHDDSLEKTAEEINYLVSDSIKRQLVSDVGICNFLSGGIDSSIITAVAANELKTTGKSLDTFSLEFIDNDKYFKAGSFQNSLDTPWIKEMTDMYNTNHTYVRQSYADLEGEKEINIDEKVYEFLKISVDGRDLPGMADIDSSLGVFCREVKKNFTVSMSGECADEIFAGYPWFYKDSDFTNDFPWNGNFELRKAIVNSDILRAINPEEYVKSKLDEAIKKAPVLSSESEEEKKMKQLHYLNFSYFMANLLERKDRMSMQTGLEVRVPFCDYRLVQYCYNIPKDMKFHNGQEKGILRLAFKDLLPENVLNRKKNPYPKTYNPIFNDSVKRLLEEVINNSNSKIIPLIDVSFIKKLLSSNSGSSIPWYGQLMDLPRLFAYLLQIEIWLQKYKVEVV